MHCLIMLLHKCDVSSISAIYRGNKSGGYWQLTTNSVGKKHNRQSGLKMAAASRKKHILRECALDYQHVHNKIHLCNLIDILKKTGWAQRKWNICQLFDILKTNHNTKITLKLKDLFLSFKIFNIDTLIPQSNVRNSSKIIFVQDIMIIISFLSGGAV